VQLALAAGSPAPPRAGAWKLTPSGAEAGLISGGFNVTSGRKATDFHANRRGLASGSILDPVREQVGVENFSESDAVSAADLQPATVAAGLSLGDRACLALAQRLNMPVLTADRAWTDIGLDVVVQLIRSRDP
jgi:hypothetical protein